MKKIVNWIVIVFSIFTLAGGSSIVANEKMAGADLVAIQESFEQMQEVLVLDVRPEDQYADGHVTYAVNMPLDTLEEEMVAIEEFYGKDFPIVVYCNSDNMSTQAKEILDQAGYTDVTVADGVKDFEYNLVTYENILLDDFLQALENEEDMVIIDYQFEKDFNKVSVEGAILGDPENMDLVLEQLPEDKSTPIYNYCYVGVRSGLGAQIIKDAGYENVYNLIVGSSHEDFPLVEK